MQLVNSDPKKIVSSHTHLGFRNVARDIDVNHLKAASDSPVDVGCNTFRLLQVILSASVKDPQNSHRGDKLTTHALCASKLASTGSSVPCSSGLERSKNH